MHELSIANAILERVEQEAERRTGARSLRVGVRVGELSGVDPDALSFSFEAMVKDSPWEPLELQIEVRPWVQWCRSCGHELQVCDAETACPRCSVADTLCVAGNELDIAFLEVEEP